MWAVFIFYLIFDLFASQPCQKAKIKFIFFSKNYLTNMYYNIIIESTKENNLLKREEKEMTKKNSAMLAEYNRMTVLYICF